MISAQTSQRKLFSAALIVLVCAPLSCFAQNTGDADENSGPVLTLAQAIAAAKEYSPEIKGLKNQVQSAEAKAHQALAPYEPTLNLAYNDMAQPFHFADPASVVLQFQEQVGFPGRAFANRSALANTARSVEAQLHAMELQIAANVKTAYFAVSLSQQNLDLNLDTRDSYTRILEITKRRYAAGAIPQVDLLNAQVALYQNSNDLSDLQAASNSATVQLNVLMGRPIEDKIRVEDFNSKILPLPTMAEAESRMVENRNEIKAARFTLEAAKDSFTLAKLSLLPDFLLTAGMTDYKYASASPWSGQNSGYPTYTYMAGVQIMIPIFGLFNERQAISGASHDRANADAQLQITLNQSRITLKNTLETLKALASRLQNNEEHLLPLSEQALSLALINYSAGKIDFQTLVDTATARRNIRHDYYSAIVNYLTTYASLGQLLGEEL